MLKCVTVLLVWLIELLGGASLYAFKMATCGQTTKPALKLVSINRCYDYSVNWLLIWADDNMSSQRPNNDIALRPTLCFSPSSIAAAAWESINFKWYTIILYFFTKMIMSVRYLWTEGDKSNWSANYRVSPEGRGQVDTPRPLLASILEPEV